MSPDRRQTIPGLPPLGEPFPDVRRIAVLRGGGLGDLVFALPAIAALRAAYPGASVTLLGSPVHRALLAGRPDVVDEVDVLPVVPGVGDASGTEVDEAATERFVERHRARGYDLAVQVHGGGRNSNPFLLRLGARHTIGTRTSDAVPLERTIPYVYYQHEVLRALEVVALAGAAPAGGAVLTPTPAELERGAELLGRSGAGGDGRPVVALHPGASDPRRRWSPDRFGHLAARLSHHGVRAVVVGEGEDVALADRIVAVARAREPRRASLVGSLAGQLSLSDLVGVLASVDAFVGNDSGPRHVAEAVGTATSSVFWFGNVINAGALGRTRHRVAMAYTTACPVCGADITQVGWTAERCEHDVSVVDSVTVDEVWENTREVLDGVLADRGERVGRDLDERDHDVAGRRHVDEPDGDERSRHGTAAPDPARGELLAGTAARPGGASVDAS
ncbi:glycosyltransferase family 9 protein [Frigoribacterium endophyticum]|uniref:glycosyltransferase family 9 protein n=1 Tax=Frigoribacterium endophyticum TaxID=1522176 RepID=UPI0031334CD6|nr:ADP-heptose:LPS heptosyltransferase [Frigoribacterium endophyticum]